MANTKSEHDAGAPEHSGSDVRDHDPSDANTITEALDSDVDLK